MSFGFLSRLTVKPVVSNFVRRCSSLDQPVPDMENPYKKSKTQCILCKYKIELNYKNPRLLSQFVSPLTGNIYDKHITGLCEAQQGKLVDMIRKSRYNGLMPVIFRDPKFKNDPKLFDPTRPIRPNPY
ncbi:28S ribosomal protein S18c, mitochondrial-like [Panonychus citri]|uniref:28S ribosomal protein S18c, mitochondrial-like n=1 Tax=Panonychus citri TaxID=50023 RepID=UPI0023083285|nr:28S ribosomal protein S18c, mitochondrial-like [Panonychus citri]